jgi:RimJ/RimL family protein N-acetyltransferase
MTPRTYQSLIPLFDELRGERVVVRPYRMEDAEALFAAIDESREHLRAFLPLDRFHQVLDDTRDFIARKEAAWRLREDLTLGIWEAVTGRFLGGTGYHLREARRWELGYFEIGYWLRKSAEGHGYMTEVVRLLTDYAFESLGANRVEIVCDARNVRSAAVPRRLGFVLEGWLRNHRLGPDSPISDTLIFALTRDDPRWPDAH